MILVFTSILVLTYAFPSRGLVSAQSTPTNSYSLSDDITTYIPACAQPCFQSFVETGFPASLCSTSPSLNCLCSHSTALGYTLGEGALQCILAEHSVNACQGTNSNTTVVLDALNMCVGTSDALPNTHSTITATLVVPSTLPTVALNVVTGIDGDIPTIITSTSVASTTTSAIRTTSSYIVSVSPGTAGSPTITALGASQPPQSSAAPTGLTTPQISGIAVGSVILVIVFISALVLFICIRRRGKLRNDNESDFGTFHEEHGNSMEQMFRIQAEKKNGPGGNLNGVAGKTRPVVPPRVVTDPNMFSRRSIPAELIGIALSPDLDHTMDSNTMLDREFEPKHSSKLLPEKPSLPMPVPKTSPLPKLPSQSISHPNWHPQPVQGLKVDSTLETRSNHRPESEVTAFEEDLPANLSSPPDLPNHPIHELDYYTERNWRSGPLSDWQDGLVPRASTAPMEAVIRPLKVRKAQSQQSFSQPHRPLTVASSIYSPAVQSEMPRSGSQRLQVSKIAESYQPYVSNPYAYDSASCTSIESSVGEPEPRTAVIPPPELSPVVESPVAESPVGRSPVSYPKIPGRLSDEQRYWAPPKEPKFESWRQAGISAAKLRELEPNGLSISTNNAESPRNVRHAKSPKPARPYPSTESDNRQIATRRGNKAAPALDFQSDRPTRRPQQENWRMGQGDHETDSQKVTPTKVGNDLYLNVQNI